MVKNQAAEFQAVKILILGGGDSPERQVSLRSAKAVAAAARQAGYEVDEADPADGYEILDKLSKDTIVLPILHGAGGEDGVIQKELEERGLAYLGSDSQSSKDCFDKWRTREILSASKIPMPEAALVTSASYDGHPLAKKPHVLKVRHGGSSIGTLIVRQVPAKASQVEKIFQLETEAVLEQLIDGPEMTIPVLDNTALTAIEIVPPEGLEFDYENKYNGATAEICPPKSINQKIQAEGQKLAEQVHRLMGCRHLSRTDIMVDKRGGLYVLEINTIPGLTDQSLYPKSAAVAGLSMPKLVDKFINMVVSGG